MTLSHDRSSRFNLTRILWKRSHGRRAAVLGRQLMQGADGSWCALQKHAAMGGRVSGAQLPLFLLQRGALAAAVAASLALDQALAQGARVQELQL